MKTAVKHPECLNEGSKTLDEFIFDYFNAAYPDEVAAVMSEWEKLNAPTKGQADE